MNGKIKAPFIISILFYLFISMSAFAATVHYAYDNLNCLTKVEYDISYSNNNKRNVYVVMLKRYLNRRKR